MWIEKVAKTLMLVVGIIGVIVIYSGFFYLLFSNKHSGNLPWYILLSPWLCIYFGLNQHQQHDVRQWLKQKFIFKRK
ncbi:hypothetical protein [Shewanella sp. Isolate11]|uniref:hypothetical protein n=1 Tax=Shewanella sp. Isolate11 TaxID=2908530 RepID=UPI001EFE9354|nr:hypothetical protein [Shewanella sp. Isolate11]MCG9696910.1 hypothetical protein [Shewanella sp. Isolate11]